MLIGVSGVSQPRAEAARSLQELERLADSAGAVVELAVLQDRSKIDSATFIGRGKATELGAVIQARDLNVAIFDNELSPAQQRNLEAALGCKVVDRAQLILDIFARRARTREGKLQVELAQLRYLLPRLVGAGEALSRLGGGIGTRGPGETKLETDRRKIRHRIAVLGREIEHVRARRAELRDHRKRSRLPTVALVGYTNAGKSTLFNLLARERTLVSNALFATLDPLVRVARLLDRREVLVSDTVGFIERLPHTLVAAFRATLEEVARADLLLHVIDSSNPEAERQIEAVRAVLAEVGAADVKTLPVLNKIDRVEPARLPALARAHPGSVAISALTGEGLHRLQDAIAGSLALETQRARLRMRAADRSKIAAVYRHARVLRHTLANGHVTLDVEISRRALDRFRDYLADAHS